MPLPGHRYALAVAARNDAGAEGKAATVWWEPPAGCGRPLPCRWSSAALSLCTTAHPLYAGIAKILDTSISETKIRPNPTCRATVLSVYGGDGCCELELDLRGRSDPRHPVSRAPLARCAISRRPVAGGEFQTVQLPWVPAGEFRPASGPAGTAGASVRTAVGGKVIFMLPCIFH
jgi:hypothetical protein